MRVFIPALILLIVSTAFAADSITTADQAVAQFRAIMRKSVEQRTGKKVPAASGQAEQFAAQASTSLAVHERVSSTLLPSQIATSIRLGSLQKLLPNRKVWVVSHSIDVFSGFDAVLDARDGKLIFLWFIPEG